MVNRRIKLQQQRQLRAQLVLAATKPDIQADIALKRLVQRGLRRLQASGNAVVTAEQVARDLGYYLFCHHYTMPRAAYELLAVAQTIQVPDTPIVPML